MDFSEQRELLVKKIEQKGVFFAPNIKNAFLKVKREEFFPEDLKQYAYVDSAFAIGYEQTISQPSTIAIMLSLLCPEKNQCVLEVGSGSGYVLALLKEIAGVKGKVFGVERIPELAEKSKKNLALIGYSDIEIISKDGSTGLKEKSPFDRILVSAACTEVPKKLLEQLSLKGKLVAPVGPSNAQKLVLIEKTASDKFRENFSNGFFVFVPLIQE